MLHNLRFVFQLFVAGCLLPISAAHVAHAADPQPTFSFQSIMDTYFDDSSGLISFRQNTVAFPPEGPFNGKVAVVDSEGNVVKVFEYFDSINRDGVFGTVLAKGPADVTLTRPGLYTIVYMIDDKPVTRMPVMLRKFDSDDPFNPEATYKFDGYWRTLAYLTTTEFDDSKHYELNLWIGGADLPEGERTDGFRVIVLRDDQMVAHSKWTQGHIAQGQFKLTHMQIYRPHTRRESPNALLFTHEEWHVDGKYEIRVVRNSDEKMIRSFDFDVKDGRVVPLERTALDYQPHVDHILPRVKMKGTTKSDMIEAIWIRDGGNRKSGAE